MAIVLPVFAPQIPQEHRHLLGLAVGEVMRMPLTPRQRVESALGFLRARLGTRRLRHSRVIRSFLRREIEEATARQYLRRVRRVRVPAPKTLTARLRDGEVSEADRARASNCALWQLVASLPQEPSIDALLQSLHAPADATPHA